MCDAAIYSVAFELYSCGGYFGGDVIDDTEVANLGLTFGDNTCTLGLTIQTETISTSSFLIEEITEFQSYQSAGALLGFSIKTENGGVKHFGKYDSEN